MGCAIRRERHYPSPMETFVPPLPPELATQGLVWPVVLWVEYDGADFAGFQRQGHKPTVQKALEEALARVHGGRPVPALSAGRTDSGVHALAMPVMVMLPRPWEPERLKLGINACLPPAVAVVDLKPVQGDFHPRHDARRKRYDYLLMTRTHRHPLLRDRCWFLHDTLDETAVRDALNRLKGRHDFRAFCTERGDELTFVRDLSAARLKREGDLWRFSFEANGFLYRMVRRLMGALVNVGRGEQPAAAISRALRHPQDSPFMRVAPPGGLTLQWVRYAPRWFLSEAVAYELSGRAPALRQKRQAWLKKMEKKK